MRASILLLAAAPLILAGPASAQGAGHADKRQASRAEEQFLDFAAQTNRAEIQAGMLAESKAREPAVKAYARLMVLDHSELQSQLAAFASRAGVDLPKGAGKKNNRQIEKLSAKSGAAFDRAYIIGQVQDHQKVLTKFQSEGKNAQNDRMRGLARAAVPFLGQHLALAGMVEQSLKRAQAANSNGAATTGSNPGK